MKAKLVNESLNEGYVINKHTDEMPYGKYKGTMYHSLPSDYKQWLRSKEMVNPKVIAFSNRGTGSGFRKTYDDIEDEDAFASRMHAKRNRGEHVPDKMYGRNWDR